MDSSSLPSRQPPAMRTFRICLHESRHEPTILEIVRREAALREATGRPTRPVSLPQRVGAFA